MEYVFLASKTFWYDQRLFFKPGIIVCVAARHHPCPPLPGQRLLLYPNDVEFQQCNMVFMGC